jgi:putative Mg2+ transporter-C (MgtC) family protein
MVLFTWLSGKECIMTLEQQMTAVGYVFLAAILSMIIGSERQRRHKAAGLRTHMLVGVGACLFTVLSTEGFPGTLDTSRVAAQIVTGIGFLGAGIIFKQKGEMHDLTTAASIWATAAIGMTIGVGAWFLAISATLLVWLILAVLLQLPGEHK